MESATDNSKSTEENCWSQVGNTVFQGKMRRIFDRTDLTEIKGCIIKYSETLELVNCRYPNMGPARSDWALAMALAPEWYGDELTTRLQNSMVVSALLLTVTAAIFIDPPLDNKEAIAFRCLIYVTGACNMLFIMSIMTGIFFIENAMSRAYGQSERFCLIIKFYFYKDIAQIFMAIGSALFPIILAIPMWEKFKMVDANILIAFTIFYVLATLFVMIQTSLAAQTEQFHRLGMFLDLVDKSTGRVLPCYYPDNADMQPDDYKAMYAVTKIETSQRSMFMSRVFSSLCPQ